LEGATSIASIPDGRHITATGAVTVQSNANGDGHALADGSATAKGGTGVGVAVAVNRNDITNLGFVGNGAIVDGKGLAVGATMADRSINAPVLAPANVVTLDSSTDATFRKDSIYLGLGSGLKTGDEVRYFKESGSEIGGLKDGKDYYVAVAGDGTIRL